MPSWTSPGSHIYDVPSDVDVLEMALEGGSGGDGDGSDAPGDGDPDGDRGLGGVAQCKIPTSELPGVLEVRVAGSGNPGSQDSAGGYNGGASGGRIDSGDGSEYAYGGGGGGASDVRDDGGTNNDRYAVAGGGGGGGAIGINTSGSAASDGGGGGYTAGQDADDAATAGGGGGGTQDSGGSGGDGDGFGTNGGDGSFGSGGGSQTDADGDSRVTASGGGAGGWYGGGGGAAVADGNSSGGAGAGGASSYVVAAAYETSFSDDANAGDGSVSITELSPTASNLTTPYVGATEVDLDWDGQDADEYEIERDGQVIATVDGSATSYTDDTASENTTYTYQVFATSGGTRYDSTVQLDATTGGPPETTSLTVVGADQIDLSASEPNADYDELRLYRQASDEGSFTLADSTTDASNYSYSDTGLRDGREYTYEFRTDYREGESSAATEIGTTDLPAPSDIAVTDERDTELDASWTLNSDDEQAVEILTRETGTTNWTVTTTLAAGSTSGTADGLLNGEEYDVTVRVTTDDATSDTATPETATTTLPNEDQPALGNGIEDEVAWDRETQPTNNGNARLQIRETGENSWDGNAAGFVEQIVAYDVLTGQFTDRLDGEEYEVRARTETEHVIGAWTDPTSIITLFPAATGLTAGTITETSVELSWSDNSDNEDGFRVVRERRVGGAWWPEHEVVDLAANTTTFTDDTAQPDTEYRYRIRAYTEYTTSDSEAITTTTGSPGLSRRQLDSQGWSVGVDTPAGRTLRPTILSDPKWQPQTNGLPTLELPVAGGERWLDDSLWDQPCRVWIDGQRLPLDTLDGAQVTPTGATLEISGGRHLKELIEGVQVDEQETHLAAEEFITDNTPYASDVDDPQAETRSDITMLFGSGADITDIVETIPDDDHADINQLDGFHLLETSWFFEAEDMDGTYQTRFASEEELDGEWSGDECARLQETGDNLEGSFSTDHRIPEGEAEVHLLAAVEDDNPAFEVYLDGTLVEDVPEGVLSSDADRFDIGWNERSGGATTPEIEPGLGPDVEIVVTSTPSEGSMFVDAVAVVDGRHAHTFDDTPVDGVIQGPEPYGASYTIQTDDATSVEQIVAGAIEIETGDTSGDQALALSNDGGDTWLSGSNTVRFEEAFAEPGQQIRGRLTISPYGTQNESPAQGVNGQSVDQIELFADLEDTPVLLDRLFEGDGRGVLNDMADSGDFVWEVRRDPGADPGDRDGLQVVWTQAGQRTQEARLAQVDWEIGETLEGSFERVIVEGASRDVEGETFTAPPDGSGAEFVAHAPLIPGDERVYDPDTEEEFERGVDYRIRWSDGAIENLGGLVENETYAIDYRWKYRGEATLPTVDEAEARATKRRVSSATSNRECEQLALAVLKQVQDPRLEVTAEVVTDDPTRSLVAALSDPDIPVAGPLVIRDQDYSENSVTYTFESRRSASEIFEEREKRLDAVADRV